ncbi:hypothetical protein J3R80_05840 [Aliiroseovarius sp. Z3]|uniref:hypothetical protein n=1 Tax=Aliiroseovarius sp. Z3 TaxID=2811402 RepID=UPI0023B21EEB|nr:hypothetical protein [Aliiroseovarius sp. Z3]MDE9449988.1 hypothetical protein [Aliiroseovarius sp. Z3]
MPKTNNDVKKTEENSVEGAISERSKPSLPRFGSAADGKIELTVSSPEQVENLFGSSTSEFSNAMLAHCLNVSGQNDEKANDKNYAIAIVNEIAPQDGIEAMLATQMASVHLAMMRHSRQLANVEHIPQLEVQERVFNKLARTFTAQMEALRKHRYGGQQKVTVEHVTVNEGGQAIVGSVTPGGGRK